MTEFKVGDRVRAERSGIAGSRYRGDWIEGVVRRPSPTDLANELTVKTDEGRVYFVYKDTAQLVSPEPQRGDRVRVSYEGVVTAIEKGLIVTIKKDSGDTIARALRLADVEILERAPKPFRTGTVASRGGSVLVRFKDGRWLSPNIERNHGFDTLEGLTDQYIRDSGYELVYEPSQSA